MDTIHANRDAARFPGDARGSGRKGSAPMKRIGTENANRSPR